MYYFQLFLKTLEKCLKIDELDPVKFISAPGLAWQAALQKIKVKLELLTDVVNGWKKN